MPRKISVGQLAVPGHRPRSRASSPAWSPQGSSLANSTRSWPSAARLDLGRQPARGEADGPGQVGVDPLAGRDPVEEPAADQLDVPAHPAAEVHQVDRDSSRVARRPAARPGRCRTCRAGEVCTWTTRSCCSGRGEDPVQRGLAGRVAGPPAEQEADASARARPARPPAPARPCVSSSSCGRGETHSPHRIRSSRLGRLHHQVVEARTRPPRRARRSWAGSAPARCPRGRGRRAARRWSPGR